MIRLLAVLMFFFSCNSSNYKKSNLLNQETMTFETLAQDFHSGVVASKFMVIKDEKSLKEVYDLLNKYKSPKTETPSINFNKETVIALFLGEKTSGGHSINVDEILNVNDKLTINYKITSPKLGEMVTSVMTQPFTIIKISKTSKEIVFIEKNKHK